MSDALRAIFWTIVIVGLSFVYRACAQEVPSTCGVGVAICDTGLGFPLLPAQKSLPDAPSSTVKAGEFAAKLEAQASVCQTVSWGDDGKLAYTTVDCKTQNWPTPPVVAAPKKATFLTFRKSWQDPPLRTSRQVFTKKFVLLHVGAGVAMVIACRNPRSGETWHSEVPVPIFLVGMDYLMSRFFTEAMAVEAPVYAMQHYARAAAK